ncbi:DUF2268 domain-containing putative Zn-dependent protease [Bacillus sp. 2205SS5-2]|uniref:DUF2268 domain-containing putative Zn-dependent protease n=1 Tax=Bacillus sp. 2205SS5-2 TaxID=3109031 RepID=UPI00300561EC
MAVVATHSALLKNGGNLVDLLKSLKFSQKESEHLSKYLKQFGIYRRKLDFETIVQEFQEKRYWQKVRRFEIKYRKLWSGPDVPIYILPMDQGSEGAMSGVSFKDKIFLFLTTGVTDKKLEALFIHEYHHCVRMNELLKKKKKFNLLDSIVFEGLAEQAVKEYCGKEYVADWCNRYDSDQLKKMWKASILPNLEVEKGVRRHEHILYGKGFSPSMMGYAVGYFLIQEWLKKHEDSTKKMLMKSSETFILQENE